MLDLPFRGDRLLDGIGLGDQARPEFAEQTAGEQFVDRQAHVLPDRGDGLHFPDAGGDAFVDVVFGAHCSIHVEVVAGKELSFDQNRAAPLADAFAPVHVVPALA